MDISDPKSRREKRNLFESDSDPEDHEATKSGSRAAAREGGLSINQQYASRYEEVKRKKELQRLTEKFGKDVDADDEEDEEDEEDFGEEDAMAELLDTGREKLFAEVFASLRRNDPRIRDPSVPFFKALDGAAASPTSSAGDESGDADADAGPKSKKFTMRDEYKRAVLGGEQLIDEVEGSRIEEDERKRKIKPRTDEERAARSAFLAAAAQGEDIGEFSVKKAAVASDVTSGGKKGKKGKTEEGSESAGSEWKSTFAAAFGDAASPEDAFLREFFVNERWRDGQGAAAGEGETKEDDIDWVKLAEDELDEQFFDGQEQWEREFQAKQFRHEDGPDALHIQTFPRQQQLQEGQLRRKDNTRAAARERKLEREKEQSLKMTEELKRLKALKRRDIEEKRRAIEEVAGLEESSAHALLTKEMLEKDFDPEEFDKMMNQLFDPTYYDAIDDRELKRMEDEDMLFGGGEGEDSGDDDDEDESESLDDGGRTNYNDTNNAHDGDRGQEGSSPDALFVSGSGIGGGDDLEMLYPSAELGAMTTRPHVAAGSGAVTTLRKTKEELQQELDKQIDEYWKLHYHKVAGGLRTRFKYRDVNPETFTLSDVDVLTSDDRTLNMIAPLSGYATYLGPKENLIDRYKAIHRRKNVRQLDPTRKSRRYGELKKTIILDETMPDEDKIKIAENIAKVKDALGGGGEVEASQRVVRSGTAGQHHHHTHNRHNHHRRQQEGGQPRHQHHHNHHHHHQQQQRPSTEALPGKRKRRE